MDALLLEVAAYLKMMAEGLISQEQAKREAAELLDKVGARLAGDA